MSDLSLANSNIQNGKVGRGRPKKTFDDQQDIREALLRAGVQVLTETGFTRSGIDGILKLVGVPKGSFYYYFNSKEAFGLAVLARYRRYFEGKLESFLTDQNFPSLIRLQNFSEEAQAGMARFDFKRSCLVGNLEQESIFLSDEFRQELQRTYAHWQAIVAKCLQDGLQQGELVLPTSVEDCAQAFWIGWEGAVHRARLMQSNQPLQLFINFFISTIKTQ